MARRLSSNPQPFPMPKNYTGGSQDFGIVRALDGHITLASDMDEARNCFYPNDPGADMAGGDDPDADDYY